MQIDDIVRNVVLAKDDSDNDRYAVTTVVTCRLNGETVKVAIVGVSDIDPGDQSIAALERLVNRLVGHLHSTTATAIS